MKARLVSAAIATIALALPTTASAAALSDLLDIDTAALEDLLPGTAINVLTDTSSPAAAALGSMSSPSTGGSCGVPKFTTPSCGGGGYVPSFGFGVTTIVNITFEISLTINIDIDLDVNIGGDFGSPAPSPTRCCVCSGF